MARPTLPAASEGSRDKAGLPAYGSSSQRKRTIPGAKTAHKTVVRLSVYESQQQPAGEGRGPGGATAVEYLSVLLVGAAAWRRGRREFGEAVLIRWN